ncbi:hypothetical protein DdX_19819 [Ditylenchus destructor]|uniref:F-box domain-containing protein n=1 Tax=Ditylenchus destructor TaxID=166010 RepID=A0AAD4MIC8_9BILA|nr:hypothetical protein DdX_19819 [Ditylenchus destructor]
MDNGTMVEAFKFLNYCQLATRSLVSKRFSNLIRTHRRKLALLDVNEIYMYSGAGNQGQAFIKLFGKELSSEDYNEWIGHNGYSKQAPLKGRIAGKENTENIRDIYVLQAYDHLYSSTQFYARAELKDETWPLFQHFFRLLMDPFIYIRTLSLYSQKDVLSLLAGAMNPDRDRLQCKQLNIRFNGDTQKLIVWIKDHVRCNEFEIYGHKDSNCEEYNEWIVHNGYSKQAPLEGRIAGKENGENVRDFYVLGAYDYQYPSTRFYARIEFKDETWPLFQHFFRLLMDPFIYIRHLELNPRKEVFSLLTGAINPDHARLQCQQLDIRCNGDTQKFIVWIKDHVRCNQFFINGYNDSNYDEELLDFFLTGAACTSAIDVGSYDLPKKILVDLVQKFMGLKSRDECQLVESIQGYVKDRGTVERLKRNFAEFIAKEENYDGHRSGQIEKISWVGTRHADANSCTEKSHWMDSVEQSNRFLFSCSVMQLRDAIFLIALIYPENIKKKLFLCALQVTAMTRNVGMIRHFNTTWDFYTQRFMSTETVMDFSSCDVDLMVLQHFDGVAL